MKNKTPFKVARFYEKGSMKLLYRLSERPLNDYFWKKRKMEVLKWLVKEKWLTEEEIIVEDEERPVIENLYTVPEKPKEVK